MFDGGRDYISTENDLAMEFLWAFSRQTHVEKLWEASLKRCIPSGEISILDEGSVETFGLMGHFPLPCWE